MSYVLQTHTVSVLHGIVICRRRLGDEPLNTATIADWAGLSPSTAKQALNLLKAEGIVRWIPLRNGRWILTGKVKLSKPKKGRSFEYMVHAYRLRQLWSRGAGQGCLPASTCRTLRKRVQDSSTGTSRLPSEKATLPSLPKSRGS